MIGELISASVYLDFALSFRVFVLYQVINSCMRMRKNCHKLNVFGVLLAQLIVSARPSFEAQVIRTNIVGLLIGLNQWDACHAFRL